MEDNYENLSVLQLKQLVEGAPGGPHNRKRKNNLTTVLRALSEEDQAAAFVRTGIARPLAEGAVGEEEGLVIEDQVIDPVIEALNGNEVINLQRAQIAALGSQSGLQVSRVRSLWR